MRQWELKETSLGTIIYPTFHPKCPFCGAPLTLHRFAAYYTGKFYHCDVHMKCPYDDWFTVFGVPISAQEYDKLRKSPLNNKVLTNELVVLAEDLLQTELNEVKKRLETWGYW